MFNIISVGILLINNYPKQLSKCFLHNFRSYTIDSDISYVGMFLPMFNSKNYVIDKAIVAPKPVIEEVKDDSLIGDVYHVDVAYEDVFNKSATSTATLESQAHIRSHECAVVYKDVLHTSAHLTSHYESSMTV